MAGRKHTWGRAHLFCPMRPQLNADGRTGALSPTRPTTRRFGVNSLGANTREGLPRLRIYDAQQTGTAVCL